MLFFIGLGLFAIAGAILKHGREPDMSKLTDAVDGLIAEVADSNTKLDSITAFIVGVPELVAAAVAEALENASVEADEAADLIDAARSDVSDKVDAALAAISNGTEGEDTQPGADTTTEPAGENTTAGGEGEDTISG